MKNQKLIRFLIVPLSIFIFIGAYNTLDRFELIKAEDFQVVNKDGETIFSLIDFLNETEKAEINSLNDKILILESTIENLKKEINNINSTNDEFKTNIKNEIKSSENNYNSFKSEFNESLDLLVKKSDELDILIIRNNKDHKKSIQKLNRDLKKVENKRIIPLEEEMDNLKMHKENLNEILMLDMIEKALQKQRERSE